MAKCRAIKKLRNNIPGTPEKRAALMVAYLQSKSPTVKTMTKQKIINSPEDIKSLEMADAVFSDIKEIVQSTRKRRSDDARVTRDVISAVVNGEKVTTSKCKLRLTNRLGFTPKQMSKGNRKRVTVLKSERSAWTFTERKTRSNALSKENREEIYQFWLTPDISRPTGNKADIKRVRLEKNVYSTHMKHVLLKTQSEAYSDFKRKYPNIKVSIRLFEQLKPYFIVSLRPKDRDTCCCRQHVEANMLFKTCMQFRKQQCSTNGQVFENLSTLVDHTLCNKDNDQIDLKCINRQCNDCGVFKFELDDSEEADSEDAPNVEWQCYEYSTLKLKGIERKKVCLVKKSTKPKVMFDHFKRILEKFPAHRFRSHWQAKQLQHLKDNLPKNNVICVHDFSENYTCKENVEIQSDYFMRPEVSLHVTVLYRHWLPSIDGLRPNDESSLVEEHLFCISEDPVHDHHFTHAVQQTVVDYLKHIDYELEHIHEWTDGCSAQYKSRHCLGDLSFAKQDFGCSINRSYFETSHAKGVQDAAGGLIKNFADRAIARGTAQIQNARDFYDFCSQNLVTVKKTGGCKRRLFYLIDTVDRTRKRYFKPVPNIRSIHQAIPKEKGNVLLKQITCTLDSCLQHKYAECMSVASQSNEHKMIHESKTKINTDTDIDDSSVEDLIRPDTVLALYTDDKKESFYLVKCLTPPMVLDEGQGDTWNNYFTRGAHIAEGLYYDRTSRSTYTLIKNKPVLFPIMSVLYIKPTMSRQDTIILDTETKQTVMSLSNEVTESRTLNI